MQNILVTGCNGFVGSHVCQQLAKRGHRVTGIDMFPYHWKDDFQSLVKKGKINYIQGDITDEGFTANAIESAQPQIVIHLASVVGVNSYMADPLRVIEVNILGLRNLLRSLKGSGARIVFSSTSEVYGKNTDLPWREDADRVVGPTNVSRWSYSTSKATAEHMIWACAGVYRLEAVVLRYFNLFGPRQRPDLIIPAQIKRALTGKEMILYDGGNQTRCFTYIEDAVLGTLAAAFSPSSNGMTFNIGSTVETSVGEATRLVGEMAGNGGYSIREVNTDEMYGKHYEDIPRRLPDTSSAALILGWRANTPLREGIIKTVQWWRGILADGADIKV